MYCYHTSLPSPSLSSPSLSSPCVLVGPDIAASKQQGTGSNGVVVECPNGRLGGPAADLPHVLVVVRRFSLSDQETTRAELPTPQIVRVAVAFALP